MDMTRRAYSLLSIKSVNDERRIIRGIATVPAVDRAGDVVEPLGMRFKNPLALLWQHDSMQPIGTVKFDKPTKDGITFEAELPVISEPGTLKDRIDEAWQSIKLGLVKCVSIGFRVLEYALLETGGIHFVSTECLELSVVTIPAQSAALITSVSGKSMDAKTLDIIKRFDVGAVRKSTRLPVRLNTTVKGAKPGPQLRLTEREKFEMRMLQEKMASRQRRAARGDEPVIVRLTAEDLRNARRGR
jgi:HK97 family phage prohead protease